MSKFIQILIDNRDLNLGDLENKICKYIQTTNENIQMWSISVEDQNNMHSKFCKKYLNWNCVRNVTIVNKSIILQPCNVMLMVKKYASKTGNNIYHLKPIIPDTNRFVNFAISSFHYMDDYSTTIYQLLENMNLNDQINIYLELAKKQIKNNHLDWARSLFIELGKSDIAYPSTQIFEIALEYGDLQTCIRAMHDILKWGYGECGKVNCGKNIIDLAKKNSNENVGDYFSRFINPDEDLVLEYTNGGSPFKILYGEDGDMTKEYENACDVFMFVVDNMKKTAHRIEFELAPIVVNV